MWYKILIRYNWPTMADYPDIGFLNIPNMSKDKAEALATVLNLMCSANEDDAEKYNVWHSAVPIDYELQTYGYDL